MATTVSITSTYAGEFSGKYISAALLSSPTLDNGNIEIKPNVKFKDVIKKVATDANVIKDATCDFTDTATVTLTERILQPEEFQVNLELCKKDFVSDWEAISMGYSSLNQNLPPKFSDFIIGHVAGLVAEKNENNIWGGVNGNAGEFDGFTVLMAADSDVNDAANDSATAFTSSNIVSLLENVVDALPSAVYGKEDVKIYVPTIAFQSYIRHLGGYAANGVGAQGIDNRGSLWYDRGSALSFDGIEVVLAPGMPSDHIVAGQKSNLYFGTGLLSDHNEVKLLDMADLDGSQNVRVVMRFTAGVQYGIGSDLALLTLA
jgi:hypothetical protein